MYVLYGRLQFFLPFFLIYIYICIFIICSIMYILYAYKLSSACHLTFIFYSSVSECYFFLRKSKTVLFANLAIISV